MNSAQLEQYLSFIRYSMGVDTLSNDISCLNWDGLFRFAYKQSLLGVCFNGISKLDPIVGHQIPQRLLHKWLQLDLSIRRQNLLLNKKCEELTQQFQKDGFESCILKGQGNASMYPDPNSRQCGDIDIWLNAQRRIIIDYITSNYKETHISFHHISFRDDDVEIEVHYMPDFSENIFRNKRIQKWYKREAANQFSNKIAFLHETPFINVPTWKFNVVFQLSHIMHHLFIGGIGMRQLMDYYYLLMQKQHNYNWEQELKPLGLLKFAKGLMWALADFFNIQKEYMICKPDPHIGKMIIREVISGGNFGQFIGKKRKNKSKILRLWHIMLHNLCYFKEFPVESISRPLFLIYHQMWKLFYKY